MCLFWYILSITELCFLVLQLLTDRFAPSGDLPSRKCDDLKNYCGGTFKGIEKHLDYITGLGVNAVWISPIVQNTDRGYHGYWAQNIFEINPHFGSRDDLKSLVAACHERGVWVMLDLVANHMGYPPGTGFNNLIPFNESRHYHPQHSYIKWPQEFKTNGRSKTTGLQAYLILTKAINL